MLDTSEDKAGLALLVVGTVILAGYAISLESTIATVLIVGIYVAYAVISILAGVAAAFATAAVIGASFGLFSSAVLRLAGVIVFTAAISAVMPYGGILTLFIYIGLLMWLFELEIFEVIVFTVILWGIRLVVAFILGLMLVAAVGAMA